MDNWSNCCNRNYNIWGSYGYLDFQVSGSFNQAANVSATLVGGALPQNIFWVIAGTVTVGANAIFQGNILAKTNVDIDTNATDNGCIYAQTAVNLKEATVLCSGGTIAPPIPPTSVPATSVPPTTAPPTVTSTPTSSSATATFSPQCTPTAAPCFTVEFQNLNASIQGDDFLTFTLADTDQECIDLCACLPGGCAFVNPHLDSTRNTTMLTCAFYAGCHTAADATNFGGQTQPDGSLSTVSSSSGFCLTPCGLRH